jgi:hypothetical protein
MRSTDRLRGPIPALLLLAVALVAREARAGELEHRVAFGVGAAVEVDGRAAPGGGNLFVEWEAIAGWLDLKLGASALAADGGVEIPIDLLFEKPFRLHRQLELMVGLGPELLVCRHTAKDGQFFAFEVAAALVYWPSRHVGLYVEPSYVLAVRDGLESRFAATSGVLFGW